MQNKLSIIIPNYNSEKTIGKLLDSIKEPSYKPYEVIIVDDRSTDNSLDIIKKYSFVKLIILDMNSGPAIARNKGAEEARGNILFFLDSDTILLNDSLRELMNTFDKYKEVVAVTGIYTKDSVNKGFFPEYKGLQMYWQWTNNVHMKYITVFGTNTGAILKNVFFEVGGFKKSYKGADVEDYEFSRRLLKKGKILCNCNVLVRHHFPGFWKYTKIYFKRTFQWTRLLLRDKMFDDVGPTLKESFGTLFGFLSLIIFPFGFLNLYLFYLLILFLIFYGLLNANFFNFLFKERGFRFMFLGFFTHMVMSFFIISGAGLSIVSYPFYKN